MKKKLGFILALLLLIPSLALAVDMQNVKMGGRVTVRGYSLNNFFDFNSNGWDPVAKTGYDDEWSMFRVKGSVFTSVDMGDNVTGYVQFTNQTFGENVWESEAKAFNSPEDNISNKVFLDNAYIDVKNLFDLFTLRAGRQNMIYGSGFVILDGQSQFASTCLYFDGVKLSTNITENILLDAFYMKDQENKRADNVFGKGRGDDITFMGLYLTATGCPVIGGKQEVYVLNREDETNLKDIYLYGIRLSDKFENGLDYSAEIGVQKGTSCMVNQEQNALGYKLDLGYTFNAITVAPRIFGQLGFMSGDDAKTTDKFEGWDVFYGGWPQFGDLLAWKFVNAPVNNVLPPGSTVGGEANFSNLSIATIGASCAIDQVVPKLSYSKIHFDEPAAGKDDDFGDFYQVDVSYKYSKALTFGIYFAIIRPGDGFNPYNDTAKEFYWEADLKF